MAALKSDVVVTAIASTTALAPDAEGTWQQLLAGGSGIRELEKPFVTKFESPVRIGGELRENIEEHLTRIELRRLSFMQQMSTVLGRRLWEAAGSPEVDTRRLLVSIAHGFASTEPLILQYDIWVSKGMKGASPLAVQMHMPNAPAAAVGLDRGAKAGVISPEMADASGAAGIAQALRSILLDDADIAICGGVEAQIEAVPIAALTGLGMLTTNNDDPAGACRPFDADRDGMVFAEGGALMLIETEEHAKARGATIYAEIAGAGLTSDAFHIAAPEPEGAGAGRAMKMALEAAGAVPADVVHLNAHATSTPIGDTAEAKAIRVALGSATDDVAISATKSMTGHLLGAAGALESIFTILAVYHRLAPPTINVEDLDPEIDLDVVRKEPRAIGHEGQQMVALNNSFGFGGHNVALVVRSA
jgi:beta-ketoacyl ACP synthase